MNGIWNQFLTIVEQEVGGRVVETWLKAIVLEKWDVSTHTVYLRAPNTFVKQWVSTNYLFLIESYLKRLLHVNELIVIFSESLVEVIGEPISVIPATKFEARNNDTIENAQYAKVRNSWQRSKIPLEKTLDSNCALTITKDVLVPSTLNTHAGHIKQGYEFETFVVGPNNSLAFAAAQAVTEKPGCLYNPLFLYGNSGLGKTHLLHAIGNRIKKQNSQAVVVYQSTDRFVNEFINAIRFDHIHKFQQKYQKVDLLLIDDIQFLSNKEQTQEAFFNIFNVLYDFRKQIVFSCDSVPKGIAGLAERLRSRLEWGLVADIQVPSIETKIAILKKKAENHHESLDDDVAYFIASRVVSNIRELEGALIRVCAFAKLTSQKVSLELAERVLVARSSSQLNQSTIDPEKIAKKVCAFYSYSLSEVRSSKRNQDLAYVRHVAMYVMKRLTKHSLQEIGRFWGRKDHSTVLHAVGKIESQRQHDTVLGQQLERLEHEIARL
ncbi:MAG TPA: chromosomal replication initiator protein DnaA [Candidatus Babeliales bacterium]|nr:chromosomal replication initiator protein DnaA [Candidatus Babeliales bacterium]